MILNNFMRGTIDKIKTECFGQLETLVIQYYLLLIFCYFNTIY